ncbi:hypothetical protein ACF0H5_005788 [Mactra antiquata]
MDCLHSAVVLMLIITFYNGMVHCLIGLRPANQWPHKQHKDHTFRPKTVSPIPTQTQYTQLHSPHENPSYSHNYTVKETELGDAKSYCPAIPILRCASHLLLQMVRNNSNHCHDIQHFTICVINVLRENGRRDFVTGLVVLQNLHLQLKDSFRCHGNVTQLSLAGVRHSVSKRHGSRCCTEAILNCAIQTFLKMYMNNNNRCHLVGFYDTCMNEVSKTCNSSSISTTYPVFVSQMRRQCQNFSNRDKRSDKIKSVMNLMT